MYMELRSSDIGVDLHGVTPACGRREKGPPKRRIAHEPVLVTLGIFAGQCTVISDYLGHLWGHQAPDTQLFYMRINWLVDNFDSLHRTTQIAIEPGELADAVAAGCAAAVRLRGAAGIGANVVTHPRAPSACRSRAASA